LRYYFIFIVFTLNLFGFNYGLKPYAINDNVTCFFGVPDEPTPENGGNTINSCYIETKEGYIVIDSGPTYNYAHDTYEIMEKRNKIPVKYLINTASEEIHVLGSAFFKEQGAIVIGPNKYINNDEIVLKEKILKETFFNTRLVESDTYLTKDYSLKIDDIVLNIKYIDDGHLIVHLPKYKIVFAGDIIYNNRIVAFESARSLIKWKKGLKLLSDLSWIDVISAHGYKTRRSALKNSKSYLALLENEILNSLSLNRTREETISKVKLLSFSDDRLYNIWHRKNVGYVYDELKNTHEKIKPIVELPVKIKPVIKVKSKVIKKVKKKVSKVNYVTFNTAMKAAIKKKKIVFIKVRSTTCRYCDELDELIKNNNKVKKIITKYFEIVEINVDYKDIPLENIRIEGTPTLLFIRPENKRVLMNLTGIRALGEFLDVLNEVVNDGHDGNYLKP